MRYLFFIFISLLSGCQGESTNLRGPTLNTDELDSRISNAMEKFEVLEMAGRLPATHERIKEFEAEIGATLPDDYRFFLTSYAGVRIDAVCSIRELTPFGDEVLTEYFYGFFEFDRGYNSLSESNAMAEGAPAVIPIASAPFGSQIFLFVSGERKGEVYYYDGQQRALWSDEQFKIMFSNLAPEIKNYLKLRQAGELPKKHSAFTNFYKLADTFTEYLESCRSANDGEDAG